MTAEELRIGNLLLFENEAQEVSSIHSDNTIRLKKTKDDKCHGCYHVDSVKIKPIPLTEEWLLMFGFEKNKNALFKLFNESEVPILFNKDLNGWTCDGINFSVNGTQYVHQLQNLYFALTVEELTYYNEKFNNED